MEGSTLPYPVTHTQHKQCNPRRTYLMQRARAVVHLHQHGRLAVKVERPHAVLLVPLLRFVEGRGRQPRVLVRVVRLLRLEQLVGVRVRRLDFGYVYVSGERKRKRN